MRVITDVGREISQVDKRVRGPETSVMGDCTVSSHKTWGLMTVGFGKGVAQKGRKKDGIHGHSFVRREGGCSPCCYHQREEVNGESFSYGVLL